MPSASSDPTSEAEVPAAAGASVAAGAPVVAPGSGRPSGAGVSAGGSAAGTGVGVMPVASASAGLVASGSLARLAGLGDGGLAARPVGPGVGVGHGRLVAGPVQVLLPGPLVDVEDGRRARPLGLGRRVGGGRGRGRLEGAGGLPVGLVVLGLGRRPGHGVVAGVALGGLVGQVDLAGVLVPPGQPFGDRPATRRPLAALVAEAGSVAFRHRASSVVDRSGRRSSSVGAWSPGRSSSRSSNSDR